MIISLCYQGNQKEKQVTQNKKYKP